MNAIYNLAMSAEQRNCARHIWTNWKKIHKGENFRKLFWGEVFCTNQPMKGK